MMILTFYADERMHLHGDSTGHKSGRSKRVCVPKIEIAIHLGEGIYGGRQSRVVRQLLCGSGQHFSGSEQN